MGREHLQAVELERTVREMGLPRSAQRTTLLGFAAEQEKRAKKAETTLDRALWRGRWQAFALCAVMQIVVGLIVHFAK